MNNKIRNQGQIFRRLRAGAVLVPLLGLFACSNEPPVMPADAPGISRPEEYSFGSETHAKDWRAARAVLDQLEPRFGEKSLHVLMRNLDSTTDPKTVKTHYGERLTGWTEMPLSSFAERAWAFAFVSPNGKLVLAIEALDGSESAGGIVPLNILTNLEGDRPRQ
ncbi:hypothetical protein ABID08_001648 [Rhizobium binae]|uniref:Lipoprotein n=1 Tax=Rhizobium binae TaxID=1138190 RepID=A0ABV2MCV6_9HYPH|nr:hypothetical protein [Rhizobium binae]MBX4971597.1 hypothetical protein [Rhizobium binae]MBX4993453.1 hypothetical protein [Rhizobium binae]NKL47006.1 hypothetical protein [Rhizobium leguminosarum bv. viciae]QSY83643.1 hypothetical protein J2J99_07525 [Rhizobium binae]